MRKSYISLNICVRPNLMNLLKKRMKISNNYFDDEQCNPDESITHTERFKRMFSAYN